MQRAPATLHFAKGMLLRSPVLQGKTFLRCKPEVQARPTSALPAVQGMLFIIYGVAGLGVQTLLLRLMLSCLSESRVLVLGKSTLCRQPVR